MSRPITSPSETFMDKKNIVLIGTGSGIAPYLPLLEEIIRFDKGKSNHYNFNSATLIFIAREGEQVSWISNYLYHFLSTDFINSYLNIKIYITLKKNAETVPSFLFWRSLLLIQKRNSQLHNLEEANLLHNNQVNDIQKQSLIQSNDRDPMDDSAVQIMFGRPDFNKLFMKLATKGEKQFDVFGCVPDVLKNHLHYLAYNVKRQTGVNFKLTFEVFT